MNKMMTVHIGARLVGAGEPCFVIAEAGVNHDGDMDVARALIDAAAKAGADAVKFQSFTADALVTAGAPKAEYQERAGGPSETQRDMLRQLARAEAPIPRADLLPASQRQAALEALTALEERALVVREKAGYVIAWDVLRDWIRWVELGIGD